jgi:dTDP-4-dehydrorhamnose reductase
MRCLILGGDGMLGHQLLDSWQARHDVRVTLRRNLAEYRELEMFHAGNSFDGIDVLDLEALRRVLDRFQPEAVINAIGLIKQQKAAKEALPSLEINAVFPHRLRLLCQEIGARLIHISTDCVFNGRRGMYSESDQSDAEDIYGMTKYLGEVGEAPAITLRSSIIGLELTRKKSLVEWFLAQSGQIRGFTRAIYTGLTTIEMARVIERVFLEHPRLTGLWQVASTPINKYELLTKLAASLGRTDITIVPDDSFHCDRSLQGKRFTLQTGYEAPSWGQMLSELALQLHRKGILDVAA